MCSIAQFYLQKRAIRFFIGAEKTGIIGLKLFTRMPIKEIVNPQLCSGCEDAANYMTWLAK